ncbi:MAG TPA: sulfatase-like hydrolase/transferase [Myxococcota bacterium]|nr:sulfatase-like hydrolase/transferase [Myxococcota bacterium]
MRWRRRLAYLLFGLVLVLGAAYAFRRTLIMYGPALLRDLTDPVAPNQPITWAEGPPTAPLGARPPNIVMILADDLGWNDISLNGGVARGAAPTPSIDALARSGARFTNAYAGNAVCAPSRAMLLTGRYSTRFGFEFTPTPKGMGTVVGLFEPAPDRKLRPLVDMEVARRMPDMGELGMPTSEITLAEVLRARGYHTVHIGKWHLGMRPEFAPSGQGFDESLVMMGGKYLPENHPDAVNSKQDFDPIDSFLWPNTRYSVNFADGKPFEPKGYLTDYFTDEAVKAIAANRNRPFFLNLAHWGPHTPLQALRADYDALSGIADHRLRVYAAMVRAVDRSVGRVMAALALHGLAENTLVFFTSDNGGANYIGLPEINRPYRGWKLTLFEGGIHVPFFVSWPARIAAGQQFADPVSHLDIMPTAAAAAGAPLPDDREIDGVDLLPLVTGAVPSLAPRPIFWREGHYQAVRAGGWKLHVSKHPDRVWLFDLNTDPTEQRELSAERPEKVAELRALLDAHNAEQAAPLWDSYAEMPVAIDKTLAEPEAPDDEVIWWPN